jgi:hypothetical protein
MASGDEGNTPVTDSAKPAATATTLSPHGPPPTASTYSSVWTIAAVAQLYADGFAALPLDQKLLIWHLYGAALAGRDIYYDQRYTHNLEMRDVLEEIVHAPRWRRPDDADRDSALYEVVLAQHRAAQQPDGAKIRAECEPRRLPRRPTQRLAPARRFR